ncbi:MAG: ABC transporter substrate-binding protein [Gammaproteobacteria bacterium]|nr:ABC transporter substrate-binding protein [Gammaproteobacteria bacterium]
MNCVLVLKNGQSVLADLKGRKISYSVSGFEDVLPEGDVGRKCGIGPDQATLINVNSLVPALISGQVDYRRQGDCNFGTQQLAILGKTRPEPFISGRRRDTPHDELVIVARRDETRTRACKIHGGR